LIFGGVDRRGLRKQCKKQGERGRDIFHRKI
jgi:hypothetical protein